MNIPGIGIHPFFNVLFDFELLLLIIIVLNITQGVSSEEVTKNQSGCGFTSWSEIINNETEVPDCNKNDIHFEKNFEGTLYYEEIITVTCKASKLIFSGSLILALEFSNHTIIKLDNSKIGSTNNNYILTNEYKIHREMKALRCAAQYINSTRWQLRQDRYKNKFQEQIPAHFLKTGNYARKYVQRNGKDNFTCKVEAKPDPYMDLFYSSDGTTKPTYEKRINTTGSIHIATFSNVNIGSNVTSLFCKAFYSEELKGFKEAAYKITLCNEENCDSTDSDDSVAIGIIIVGLLTCILVAFWLKLKEFRLLHFKLSEKTVNAFFNGLPDSDKHFDKIPYRKDCEIPESKIKIENDRLLGSGHFGTVNKGIWTTRNQDGEDDSIVVAIKTVSIMVSAKGLRRLQEKQGAEDKFKLFLREIKILQEIKYDGGHDNVIKYIGAMTKNIKQFNVNVILEYCEGGDLKNFLIYNIVQFTNKFRDTVSITPVIIPVGYSEIGLADDTIVAEPQQKFDTDDLIRWSKEIAAGMEYLNNLKVIHFDLAARNVLLAKVEGKLVAKINDFGLSKKINPDKKLYYKVDNTCFHAPGWQPPDLTVDRRVTLNSDIWSYGVTLWEIFNLGEDPIENLGKVSQADKPRFANSAVYRIMLKCLNKCGEKRPSFAELKTDFMALEKELQKDPTAYVDAFNDEDYGYGSYT